MNVFFHSGILGKDVEVKNIPDGQMTILVISDGDEHMGFDWIKHVSFDQLDAEVLQKLKKDVKIQVKSRLQNLRWIDPKTNRQRTRLTCIFSDLKIIN